MVLLQTQLRILKIKATVGTLKSRASDFGRNGQERNLDDSDADNEQTGICTFSEVAAHSLLNNNTF